MHPLTNLGPESGRELREALWSVHFATTQNLYQRELPAMFRPMPLARAVEVVERATDKHAHHRQRRVLTAICRRGLSQSLRGHPSFEKLRSRYPIDQLPLPEALPIEQRKLNRGPSLPTENACTTDVRKYDIRYDPRTRISSLFATVQINQAIERLGQPIDPQTWDECCEFFPQTYRCSKDDYKVEEPRPKGKTWEGYLFEVFDVGQVSFENVLGIEFDVDLRAREITLKYWEYWNPFFTFFGIRRPGVIEVDDGFVRARPDPDSPTSSTVLELEKHVAFADITPNIIADPIDYGLWLDYNSPASLGAWIERPGLMWACCHLQGDVPDPQT